MLDGSGVVFAVALAATLEISADIATAAPVDFVTESYNKKEVRRLNKKCKNKKSWCDSVTLSGFGRFSRKERVGRIVRNPATGEPMDVEPSISVGFRPGSRLKKAVREVERVGVFLDRVVLRSLVRRGTESLQNRLNDTVICNL